MRGSEIFVERTKQTGLYNIQAIDNIPSIMRRGLLSNGTKGFLLKESIR